MSQQHFPGKKISLYGKKLKMTPKIKLFGPDKKNNMKSGVKFWSDPKEKPDDELPKSK